MAELINKKKKWEVVFEHIMSKGYGDIIPHSELMTVMDENSKSTFYYQTINRANKALLENGKRICSIHSIGYRVMEPDTYTDESVRKFKQGARKIKDGTDLLTYAPTDNMSKDGLVAHRHVTDRATMLHAAIVGACTEISLLNKKPHALLQKK